MATREQRARRKIRDRKKRFEGAVSSIELPKDVQDLVSEPMLARMVTVAQDMKLTVIALVALEAMKAKELQRNIQQWEDAYRELQRRYTKQADDLFTAQQQISKMNLRYLRRGSKKARVQHPEKRRGR